MKIFIKKERDDLPRTIEGVNFIKTTKINPLKTVGIFEKVTRARGFTEKTVLEIDMALIERIDL